MECGGRFRNLCLDRERSWKWPVTLWPCWGSPLTMPESMFALPPTSRAGYFHSFKPHCISRCRILWFWMVWCESFLRPVSRKISVYVEHQPQVQLEEMVVQVLISPGTWALVKHSRYYPKAVRVIEFIWQFKCISDLILFTLWHKSLPRQMVEWRLSAWWQVSFNTGNKKILAQYWNHLRHWSKRPPFNIGWPKPRVEWRREGVVTTKGSRKRGQRLTLHHEETPQFS